MPRSSSVVCRPLEDDLQTTEDDLQTKEDDLDITEGDENVSFQLTRIDWIHLNVLKRLGIMKGDDTYDTWR